MRASAILCLLVLCASCGSDAVPFGPIGLADAVGGDADASVDGGVDPDGVDPSDVADGGADVPILNDCETNGDCVGGEVCRDGLCREVCTAASGCAGLLPVCDVASGLCVQCVASADCENGICEANVCLPVECTEARDCSGGFTCNEGRCVPLEAPCPDGERRCNGTAVQICRDGAFVVQESCAPRACEQGPEGPQCEAQVCSPATTRCDGELLAACNETGTAETTISCDSLSGCTSSAGCVCSDGLCVDRACSPGARRCEGDTVVQCSADGLQESPVLACAADQTCASGECINDTCTFGERRCDGEDLLVCSPFSEWERTDCGALGGACATSGSGAECVERVCTPRTRRCGTATREVFVCSDDGFSESRADCSVGQYCSGGTCLAQQCTPFARYCDGDNALTCRADGSGGDVTDRCVGSEVCLDGRCVADGGCTNASDCPQPPSYCAGRVLVRYSGNGACIDRACDYGAVQTEFDCDFLGAGQVCVSGPPAACAASTCTTSEDCGADFCVDGSCVECRFRSDCGANGYCDGGSCVSCGCAANQTCGIDGECVSGNADACTSNAQCQGIAEALGYTGENAACGGGQCYIMGRCGTGILGTSAGGDVFERECRAGQTCQPIFDLLGGDVYNSCGPCTVAGDCRAGESCINNILLGNYCGGPGDGGGFVP